MINHQAAYLVINHQLFLLFISPHHTYNLYDDIVSPQFSNVKS